jgi:glycosyltransferase involved in cell wall biosynthesis
MHNAHQKELELMQAGKNSLSVIVPILNSRRHLQESLDSIVNAIHQYGNAELILVDNGSTDGSFEIVNRDYGHARICQRDDVTVAA